VKPVSYNAWARKTARQRAKLDRDAYVRGQTSKQKQISVRRKLARYLAMGPAQRTVAAGRAVEPECRPDPKTRRQTHHRLEIAADKGSL